MKQNGESEASERRITTRIAIGGDVCFKVKGSDGKWKQAECLDLSHEGMRFISEYSDLSVGARIEIEGRLKGLEKKVKSEGFVVWHQVSCNKNGTEYGIKFVQPESLHHNDHRILEFLTNQITRLASSFVASSFVTRTAVTFDEVKESYRLLYREYSRRKYISENSMGMYYTYFCMLPETRTFVLRGNDELLGTVSLITDSSCGLPMESVFPDRIDAVRSDSRKLAEVSLLALSNEYFGKGRFSLTNLHKLKASFSLFKIMFDYARSKAGVTDLLIAVHPKHERLYRYLKFEPIGPVRSYPGVLNKPALPMRMNVQKVVAETERDSGAGLYFLRNEMDPSSFHMHFVWEKNSVRELLNESNYVWGRIPHYHKKILKSIYFRYHCMQRAA